jgi:putative ABC transport system substrate-binding protein
LRDLGYVEGKNITIDFRWAESVSQLPELAAELVKLNVDLIFASSSTQVGPALSATRTIPIIFANHADPIGTGHVASLARPGGNATGLSMLLTDLVGKELTILREVVPNASKIGILWNPETPSHKPAVKGVEVAGQALGMQMVLMPGRTADEFQTAISTFSQEKVAGFLALPSLVSYSERKYLAELALRYRMPGMFGLKENAEAGGLMSYGADTIDLHRRAATYIDKIFKGAKPSDLPVEQASTYEFAINLKTARALGLNIPRSVQLQATVMIE